MSDFPDMLLNSLNMAGLGGDGSRRTDTLRSPRWRRDGLSAGLLSSTLDELGSGSALLGMGSVLAFLIPWEGVLDFRRDFSSSAVRVTVL